MVRRGARRRVAIVQPERVHAAAAPKSRTSRHFGFRQKETWRAYCPSAKRYSIATLLPSMKPASASPSRNGAVKRSSRSEVLLSKAGSFLAHALAAAAMGN